MMNKQLSSSDRVMPSILLVDDDRLILATLAQGLAVAGYEVLSAESADAAEALLQNTTRPDLAVLDMNMPGRSGLELAASLISCYDLPFLLLTAYNDQAIVEQAAVTGALGYLVKPVEISDLIPAIEAALARAKDLKALRTSANQLQHALSSDRNISIAVGIVMVQYRLDRRRAFDWLRNKARCERRKLFVLAAEVIAAAEQQHNRQNKKI